MSDEDALIAYKLKWRRAQVRLAKELLKYDHLPVASDDITRRMHMTTLRRNLAPLNIKIETIWQYGYTIKGESRDKLYRLLEQALMENSNEPQTNT